MKKLIAVAATILTGLVAFPDRAEAGHSSVRITYQSGHSACGCPIYTNRYFAGYDCHGRPIYRYVGVPVIHRCSHSPRGFGQTHYIPSRIHRGPVSRNAIRYPRGPRYRPAPGRGSYNRGGSCR